MKTYIPLFMAALVAAGCTSVHRLDSTKYKVISVPQELRNPTNMVELVQGITNGTPVIFKLASGQTMPVKLTVDLPMGSMEKADCKFVAKQDTYILFGQKMGCLLSPDGQRWVSVGNPKALNKLFGSEHGDFRLGFSSSPNQEPTMDLELKTK